ncbi:hypothetical protein M9H77_31375 [Catharanthus roseus]|uniref:Uncharacterized protein n=1 Tax=Catharanthus roseus TaxID=4058 RepID=A0ACC0A457_CATRO|nr:hypothetical protein M9H77_31375 [Catharanthus roseus]
MHLINNPQEKIVLQGSNDIKFEVDEVGAKQSVMIKHMIQDSIASKGPILFPKVLGNILVKDLEYCKRDFQHHIGFFPRRGGKDAKGESVGFQLTKIVEYCKHLAFVSELVNDDEQTLFKLLVAANYLALKGILSLACEEFLYFIKKKIILLGSNDITFEVDEAMAKQSVTIKHMIEHSLATRGPILLPKVPGNILAKNDVDLRAFVSTLVNEHEETLFVLLVATDYLDIKGLLSLTCEDVLDIIKCKDLKHIRGIFNIISPEEEEKICREIPWTFN